MASKDGLKRMVMQFRVSELQALLEYAGERNRNGRKKDLQKKALNLISSKRTASLHNKIFHLYQNLSNKDNTEDGNDASYYPSYKEKYRNLSKNIINQWPYYKCNNESYGSEVNTSNFYNDVYDSSDSGESNTSKLNLVKNRFQNYDSSKLSSINFKKLPFFEFKTEVLPVTPLVPKKQDDDAYEFSTSFSLPSEVVSRLFIAESSTIDSAYQLQVRMCSLTNETEVSDSLPLSLSIKVNDKYSTLPPPIPSTNRQGMLLKRMNVPINITPEIHQRTTVNKVIISWSIECDELYAITVHLVKKYTSDELINRLKEKGERDPGLTKKAIYDNLNDEDNEIAAMSLKMSLTCPLGKILISLPVRATTCNHLQCFDGALYIKMNDVKSTWQCPVCNQMCLYENLFIDGYFADVLRSDAFLSNVTEIELDADGNWTPVLSQKRKLSDAGSPPAKKRELPPPPKPPKTPDVDLGSQSERNDLANDLQDFYYQYNRDTELCSYRSSYPILPTFSEMNNHFLDVKPVDDSDLSVVEPQHGNDAKKNVMLVDLTISDSDSDDIRSLSEDTSCDSDSQTTSAALPGSQSPPIFDISDSDCEEL